MQERKVKGYRFANTAKLNDAVATLGDKASDEAILAEYDRRGGLLFKEVKGEAVRLEMGAFYDFEKGEPKKVKKVAKKEKATKSKKSKKK